MNKIQRTATICTLVAASLLSNGCATVIGTVSGPITYTMDSYKVCRGDKNKNSLQKTILISVGVIAGPIYGALCGMGHDWYFLKNRRYHPHYNPLHPWED